MSRFSLGCVGMASGVSDRMVVDTALIVIGGVAIAAMTTVVFGYRRWGANQPVLVIGAA